MFLTENDADSIRKTLSLRGANYRRMAASQYCEIDALKSIGKGIAYEIMAQLTFSGMSKSVLGQWATEYQRNIYDKMGSLFYFPARLDEEAIERTSATLGGMLQGFQEIADYIVNDKREVNP